MTTIAGRLHWQKLGLVFRPESDIPWGVSHATCPTPVRLDSGIWRVFFASRDSLQRSHVGSFDIDLDDPLRAVTASDRPLLAPGPIGHFDGNGIYATGLVRIRGDRLRLYTVGWNPGHRVPLFFAAIGAAESADMGRTIEWRTPAPILDRSDVDPVCVTGPWVLRDSDRFRMWYVTGLRWEDRPDGLKSVYHIRYADSNDGLSWRRSGQVSIDFADPSELNIARPCIVPTEDGYEAWFSYHRGDGYRIGYARSVDGIGFTRITSDAPVIEPSDAAFETDAVCHPAVVTHRGVRFMFYNGNQFGIDGVALAVAR